MENVEQNRQEQSSESVGKYSWDLAEFTRTLVLIQPILNYDEIEAYPKKQTNKKTIGLLKHKEYSSQNVAESRAIELAAVDAELINATVSLFIQ